MRQQVADHIILGARSGQYQRRTKRRARSAILAWIYVCSMPDQNLDAVALPRLNGETQQRPISLGTHPGNQIWTHADIQLILKRFGFSQYHVRHRRNHSR
jgi:hypothetical protein